MRKKVVVEALKLGMYVAELDRPWLESPFLFQGFYLRTEEDIEQVRQVCDHVFIETEYNLNLKDLDKAAASRKGPPTSRPAPGARLSKESERAAPQLINQVTYRDKVAVEEEIEKSSELRVQAKELVNHLYEDVQQGRVIDVAQAKEVVNDLVDSIVRNPDAQMLLSQLKNKDEYTAIHSLNVSIISVAFGRHVGLTRGALVELGLGAMLHDLGKIRVPLEILNKPSRLSPAEYTIMQEHPVHGRDIIVESPESIPQRSIEVAYSHHERIDGKGYPNKLSGEKIPLYSRMVSIVDVYDAITSSRVYDHGRSATEAMRILYEERGTQFDSALAEQFIQCLGIFPVGSLVELNTGEMAIVVSMNRERHLRPKVLLISDRDKRRMTVPKILDLALFEGKGGVEIRQVLAPGEYGIDIRDYLKDLSWVT